MTSSTSKHHLSLDLFKLKQNQLLVFIHMNLQLKPCEWSIIISHILQFIQQQAHSWICSSDLKSKLASQYSLNFSQVDFVLINLLKSKIIRSDPPGEVENQSPSQKFFVLFSPIFLNFFFFTVQFLIDLVQRRLEEHR